MTTQTHHVRSAGNAAYALVECGLLEHRNSLN